MPSPTITTIFPPACSFFTSSDLFSGNTSAITRSIPAHGIASAVFRLSPVIIITSIPSALLLLRQPCRRAQRIRQGNILPALYPVPHTSPFYHPAAFFQRLLPASRVNTALYTSVWNSQQELLRILFTLSPVTRYRVKIRNVSRCKIFLLRRVPNRRSSGCSEYFSTAAASASTSSTVSAPAGKISVTSGFPLVSVSCLYPVKLYLFCKAFPELRRSYKNPYSAPFPVPTMMAVGVAAQGAWQAITSTAINFRKA